MTLIPGDGIGPELAEATRRVLDASGVKFDWEVMHAGEANAPLEPVVGARSILLLDEATAALDSESEEAIREALARLMRGRTVIAIAHRLATLRNFDRVIMLQGGRIIEDGPPDRLMQGGGPYRELVAREMSRLATHAA